MMPRLPLLLTACLIIANSYAQKKVFSYPIVFKGAFSSPDNYEADFLNNTASGHFALVLRNNKEISYLLIDRDFRLVADFTAEKRISVFDEGKLKECTGGTVSGHQYHFVYPQSKTEFQMETVDFDAKTVSHKKVIELTKEERQLVSFSDNNVFYALSTNDKDGTLGIYVINPAGELLQKNIAFPVPENAGKHQKISEYLHELRVLKSGEYPDLSNAVKQAKLFSSPGKLEFVVNNENNPAQVVTLHLPDLTLQEKKIDYAGLIAPEEAGKVYVSSYIKGNAIFSLILNKKNIRIAVNNVQTGAVLGKIDINDDTAPEQFAAGPTAEKRLGRIDNEKNITEIKKVIKAFAKGTEGLIVMENNSGKLLITAGTYDVIKMGSSSGGTHDLPGWAPNPNVSAAVPMAYIPAMYYRPGTPGFTTSDAFNYNTTYFRLLLDPVSFKIVQGEAPNSPTVQIKDFIQMVKSTWATNQFAIDGRQYYGFYSPQERAYMIQEIKIRD